MKTIKFNLKNYLDMDNINAYNKAFKETFSVKDDSLKIILSTTQLMNGTLSDIWT